MQVCQTLALVHANLLPTGSGTILDVLRLKKPLIVIPNPNLLHNHQQELASALADEQYLITSTVSYVLLLGFQPSITHYPAILRKRLIR
jgi:UDP-N-acetylglucosamine transferase subunit ALG13